MAQQSSRYLQGIDELIAETPFDRVASHYGLPLPADGTTEYRLNCVFDESCREDTYGHLTVKLTDPAKLIFCHSCRVRGNLLTLLHGLERQAPPSGGRLRGDEFKAAATKLREIAGATAESIPVSAADESSTPSAPLIEPSAQAPVNTPLRRHDKEGARALEDLYRDLISDPAEMSPQAATYFRSRPWLTDELCRKWGVGYLPKNGRSLFRGWFVYTQRNERGEVISYSGRDVQFEDKWRKWIAAGRPEEKKPNKHRFVSGYHRGVELFGQPAARLTEPVIHQSLQELGLVVVEGANDVMRLDALGIGAVGLCSNRATAEQIEKIDRFARNTADSRVVLLPDCDQPGEDGFKELLWELNERGLDVRLGWSKVMHGAKFFGKQPEDLTDDEWTGLCLSLRRTGMVPPAPEA